MIVTFLLNMYSNLCNDHVWLLLFVIVDCRAGFPRILMSEWDRSCLELCLSFGTQDIFMFAVFHTFAIVIEFSILPFFDCMPEFMMLEKLPCVGTLSFLGSEVVLKLFERLSYCSSSEHFLDEYPSDAVSSKES